MDRKIIPTFLEQQVGNLNPYDASVIPTPPALPLADHSYPLELVYVARGLGYASWAAWILATILLGMSFLNALRLIERSESIEMIYYLPIFLLLAAALVMQLLALNSLQQTPVECNAATPAKISYYSLLGVVFGIPFLASVLVLALPMAGFFISVLFVIIGGFHLVSFVVYLQRIADFFEDVMAITLCKLLRNSLWGYGVFLATMILLKASEIFGLSKHVLPDRQSFLVIAIQSCVIIVGICVAIYFCVVYLATLSAMRQLVRSKLAKSE